MGVLKCTIVLDKAEGMTLEVEDADAGAKQTVVLSADAITLTVKGSAGTSTITQKADSVTIDTKTFTLNADSISCSSNQDSTYSAGTTMSVSGDQSIKLKGLQAELSGTQVSVKADGELTAESSGMATLKGSLVSVSAPQVMLG